MLLEGSQGGDGGTRPHVLGWVAHQPVQHLRESESNRVAGAGCHLFHLLRAHKRCHPTGCSMQTTPPGCLACTEALAHPCSHPVWHAVLGLQGRAEVGQMRGHMVASSHPPLARSRYAQAAAAQAAEIMHHAHRPGCRDAHGSPAPGWSRWWRAAGALTHGCGSEPRSVGHAKVGWSQWQGTRHS